MDPDGNLRDMTTSTLNKFEDMPLLCSKKEISLYGLVALVDTFHRRESGYP